MPQQDLGDASGGESHLFPGAILRSEVADQRGKTLPVVETFHLPSATGNGRTYSSKNPSLLSSDT